MIMFENSYCKDGKIYINADSDEHFNQSIGYALIDSIWLTDEYIDFFKIVLKKILQDGGSLSAIEREFALRYEEKGIPLNSKAEIDRAIIAEYAQAHLFPDEESLASLENADKIPNIKLLCFLYKVPAIFGCKKAREKEFFIHARAVLAKALRKAKETDAF